LEIESSEEEPLTDLISLTVGPHIPAMILLADDPHLAWTAQALRAGVRAILSRNSTTEEILAAIQSAAAGLVVLQPDSLNSLLPIRPPAPRSLHASSDQGLTQREMEVLGRMAEGPANKSIASRLGISQHTVKFHIRSILTKLHASSRTEAVTLGIRQGLIML
jgi:DNA-binding NarL/FixJ family response regulator